jgi:uncharacterized membrane-anchored protein YhcB (DUF1043 family)
MVVEPWIVGISTILFGIVVGAVLIRITMKPNPREEVENGTEHPEEHEEDAADRT